MDRKAIFKFNVTCNGWIDTIGGKWCKVKFLWKYKILVTLNDGLRWPSNYWNLMANSHRLHGLLGVMDLVVTSLFDLYKENCQQIHAGHNRSILFDDSLSSFLNGNRITGCAWLIMKCEYHF